MGEVLVSEGDEVEAGQLLVRLNIAPRPSPSPRRRAGEPGWRAAGS